MNKPLLIRLLIKYFVEFSTILVMFPNSDLNGQLYVVPKLHFLQNFDTLKYFKNYKIHSNLFSTISYAKMKFRLRADL